MGELKERESKPRLMDTVRLTQYHPLKGFYEAHERSDELPKLMLSLINSILHHRFTAFLASEDDILSLYERDENWNLKTKASFYDVREVIKKIEAHQIIQPVFIGGMWAWEVICPDLLTEIQQDSRERDINMNMLKNL